LASVLLLKIVGLCFDSSLQHDVCQNKKAKLIRLLFESLFGADGLMHCYGAVVRSGFLLRLKTVR
jgi:hypothetical protein